MHREFLPFKYCWNNLLLTFFMQNTRELDNFETRQIIAMKKE